MLCSMIAGWIAWSSWFFLSSLNVQSCSCWTSSITYIARSRAHEDSKPFSKKLRASAELDDEVTVSDTGCQERLIIGSKLIHWRGEKSHGNSLQFRHAELKAALCTVLDVENLDLEYSNALSTSFDASIEMSEYQTEVYQNAMQYVKVIQNDASNEGLHMPNIEISNDKWVEAVQRCSLIRGLYEISAMGDSIENLATSALRHHSFDDMFSSGLNNNATWRVRLRQYGSAASASKSKQYGKKMRSPMRQERESVYKLKDLLIKIKGEVDLKNAEISIYILEGLMTPHGEERGKFLARQLAKGGMFEDGKSMSTIAPTSRICVTNTPLAPIEAFTVCNIARIRDGHRVLDPFCGSCTTLLAASMLATRSVLSVGIEIAHNGQVNREHIVKDFKRRNLIAPAALIHGDSMDPIIRNDALSAVGNKPFDCIVTDPPYGIREKTGYCEDPPLVNLVKCIANDKGNANRLLRENGRLVAFVPNVKGEDVMSSMPSDDELKNAGLKLCQMMEQPLNDSLSRWLVEYVCVD